MAPSPTPQGSIALHHFGLWAGKRERERHGQKFVVQKKSLRSVPLPPPSFFMLTKDHLKVIREMGPTAPPSQASLVFWPSAPSPKPVLSKLNCPPPTLLGPPASLLMLSEDHLKWIRKRNQENRSNGSGKGLSLQPQASKLFASFQHGPCGNVAIRTFTDTLALTIALPPTRIHVSSLPLHHPQNYCSLGAVGAPPVCLNLPLEVAPSV